MQLQYEPMTLNLETPLRIAHGTSLARHNVLVRIGDGEHEGLGVRPRLAVATGRYG